MVCAHIGYITDQYFYLTELSSLCGVMPLLKGQNEICNQDISKTIKARNFRLGQLIHDYTAE